MNQMMYKEININKVLYKTLIITNFNFKNIRFLFKSTKNKEGRTLPFPWSVGLTI